MFQALRKHISPTTVVAFMALVFAMTGGAFAATGSGGGGNTGAKASASVTPAATAAKAKAKPKTKAGSRGPAGPKGATGATGATGAAGPAGTAGATGPAGPVGPAGTGTEGKEGKEGKAGPEGKTGPEGKSGFTKTLPSGETETGAWAYSFVVGEAEVAQYVPISFAIPLAEELGGSQVHYILANGKEWDFSTSAEVTSTTCLGTVATPTAVAGNLCVYAAQLGQKNLSRFPRRTVSRVRHSRVKVNQ